MRGGACAAVACQAGGMAWHASWKGTVRRLARRARWRYGKAGCQVTRLVRWVPARVDAGASPAEGVSMMTLRSLLRAFLVVPLVGVGFGGDDCAAAGAGGGGGHRELRHAGPLSAGGPRHRIGGLHWRGTRVGPRVPAAPRIITFPSAI